MTITETYEDRDPARDDDLRELLSYCRTNADVKPFDRASAVRGKAYEDVATKLAAILDGES